MQIENGFQQNSFKMFQTNNEQKHVLRVVVYQLAPEHYSQFKIKIDLIMKRK